MIKITTVGQIPRPLDYKRPNFPIELPNMSRFFYSFQAEHDSNELNLDFRFGLTTTAIAGVC